MKINGFEVPTRANPNAEQGGVVIDVEALKAAWEEKDAAEREDRWNTWFKGFGESLTVKAAWFPIFEAALTGEEGGFWRVKQYQMERMSPQVVVDMVWDRVRAARPIDIADYASVKDLLKEFLAEHTAAPGVQDRNAVMWRDSAKGPGAKLYLNPFLRAKWTAQAD